MNGVIIHSAGITANQCSAVVVLCMETVTAADLVPSVRGGEFGGVVVDNFPTCREFAENQREHALGMVFLPVLFLVEFPVEPEVTDHETGVRAKCVNLDSGKRQMTHGGAIRIGVLIAFQHVLPALENARRIDEFKVV